MLRVLTIDEVSRVAGGLTDEPVDGGGGWDWSDSVSFFGDGGAGDGGNGDYDGGDIVVTANLNDSGWGDSDDNSFAGANEAAADGNRAPLPFTLNPDGSIPTYTDPTTGDIVVTAAYNNADYTEASRAVDAVVVATAGISALEGKLLGALGASGATLAGLHIDQIKQQVARAQRNAKNIYGYNLYNRLYNSGD